LALLLAIASLFAGNLTPNFLSAGGCLAAAGLAFGLVANATLRA
jgi:hypothetical protein